MALELKYASDATLLLDDLVEALGKPGSPAGVRVPVLMPSRPLVERCKTAMARRYGVWMGVEFLLPAAFIERMARLVGLERVHPSWQPEGLAWRIVPRLAAMVEQGRTPSLAAACRDTRSRLALAREVADRFDQYMHFRPQMIAAWDQGETWDALPESAHEDEAWQRALWNEIRDDLSGHPHPAQRLKDLAERIEAGAGDLPATLEVLATGPLAPAILPLLRALATRTCVRLRALLPSTEYLGDIRAGRTQMRAGHDVDPAWEGNPLLAHLGKQAIDSFCSFERDLVTEGQEYDVITHHAAQTGTLLARLQADIRAARQPAGDKPVLPLKNDRSLRVHRCHSPRREVEVLRDELLDAFDALPGLKASDVLILAPDLDTYGPQAEAILREGDPALPLRLSERRLDRSDPLVRALHLLLKLSAGRAPLSAGLALLELPAVIKCLESRRTDTETLANLLRAAGITWGLNAAHRQGLHAGNTGTGTWRDGLDRLLAGVWLGHAHEAADADGRPALPVAGDLGADPESIGNGLDWIDGVITLLETWQQEAGPSEWADRLGDALASVLAANHTRFDTTAALDIVNQLRTAETRHACGLPLDAATVTDWLEHAALDETRTVTQVGGNLAMGGFKPLRAIPCRVLAVLGLQDAVFPRRARPPAWDLLAARPYPGDRDPVREDRQLFLDALLAASDRVILTATARNIRTNKAEPLSSCVDECLRVAAQTVSREPRDREDAHRKLMVDHRLQPFSADCFAAPGNSFDAVNFKVARTLGQGPSGSDISFYQHPIDSRSVDADLDLQDVIRILKDPCSAWLRSLGIEIPSAAEDPGALDREPVATPAGLNRWQIQTEVINAELEGRTAHLQERLAADRLMPYGELGTAMGQAAVEEARALARLAIHLADGPLQPHRLVYRAGMSPVTGNITVDTCLAEHVLIMPSDLTKRAHYRLETWVRAVFAAASGMQVETLVISKSGSQPMAQRMPPMDPGQAREAFDHLLDVCLDARSRPLPFAPETSRAIYRALQGNKHQQNKNDVDRARTVWDWQGEGPPGEGNRPAPQLAWRDRHPFPEARVDIGQPTAPDDVPVADAATGLGKNEALDEWRELANWIYKRVDGWFASAQPVNPDGPI